jgi:hypothetical protein
MTLISPAGYSGTPLVKKLGIKAGARVTLVGAPNGFLDTLGTLPDGASLVPLTEASIDVALFFSVSQAEVAGRFAGLAGALKANGALWVAWPKRASGVPTDLSDGVVRSIGLAKGLVDNKVCAIDGTWSGLRFVYRLADRPKRG